VSYEEAVTWYKKSAEQGDTRGQFALGEIYEKGTALEKFFRWSYFLFNY